MLPLLIFIATFAIASSAQTYCFKQVETVQNGVRSRGNGALNYFTFQNNMNSFYISDANGYSLQAQLVYKLISKANGRYKYQQQGPMGPIGNYWIFNSDFSRANATSTFMPNFVTVWDQVDTTYSEEDDFY